MFAFGEENKLYGPDGKLCVIVSDEGGMPSYSVLYEGVTFLQKSPLGIETNFGDFTQQMVLTHVGQLSSVNEEISFLRLGIVIRGIRQMCRLTHFPKEEERYMISFSKLVIMT